MTPHANEPTPVIGRWAALHRALARLRPGRRRDEIAFFTGIDLRFDAVLIELDPTLDEPTGDRWCREIEQLLGVLAMRGEQRVLGLPLMPLPNPVLDTAADVAREWIRLAKVSFGDEFADPWRLGRAFTRFANGGLRVPYSDDGRGSERGTWVLSEPDSAYFLLFAEFAAVASAADPGASRHPAIDADYFANALPAVVAGQAIVLDVYEPRGGWKGLADQARWHGARWPARRVEAHLRSVLRLRSPASLLRSHRINLRRVLRAEPDSTDADSGVAS